MTLPENRQDQYLLAVALIRNRLGEVGGTDDEDFHFLVDEFSAEEAVKMMCILAAFSAALLETIGEEMMPPGTPETMHEEFASYYLDEFMKGVLAHEFED